MSYFLFVQGGQAKMAYFDLIFSNIGQYHEYVAYEMCVIDRNVVTCAQFIIWEMLIAEEIIPNENILMKYQNGTLIEF